MPAKTYHYDFSVLEREDAISFYLLGCYYSDGNIQTWSSGQLTKAGEISKNRGNRFKISANDEDWIELIKNLLNSNHNIRKDSRSECYSLAIDDVENINWFLKWGCIPNKSRIIKFPDIPDNYLSDFIRGTFDGDGSITQSFYKKTKKNGKEYFYKSLTCYICSGSKDFILSMKEAIDKVGIIGCFVTEQPKKFGGKNGCVPNNKTYESVYRLSFSGSTARKFLEWVYYNPKVPAMPRKKNSMLNAFSYFEKNANRATREDYELQKDSKSISQTLVLPPGVEPGRP